MSRLSISTAWDETRSRLASDGRLFVAVALALLVLPQTALGAFSPTTPADADADAIFYVLLIVALIAGLIGQISLNRLAIPPDSTVGHAIKRGIERLVPLLLALIFVFLVVGALFFILAVILLVGGVISPPATGSPPPRSLILLLLIIFVGVYPIFQLVIPTSAAEPGGPVRLLSRAWTLGKRSYWRLAAFLVLVLIGMLIVWLSAQVIVGLPVVAISGPLERGSIPAALIALLVAMAQAAWTVVASVMLARIYVQLSGGTAGGTGSGEITVPHSGT